MGLYKNLVFYVFAVNSEYVLRGGKPHSFGNINVPLSQGLCKRVQSKFICFYKRAQPRLAKSNATLISRCRRKKYSSKLDISRLFVYMFILLCKNK